MASEEKAGIDLKVPGFELSVSTEILKGCTKPVADLYGFLEDWIEDRRHLLKAERQDRYKLRSAKVLRQTQNCLDALDVKNPERPSDKLLEIAGPAITAEDSEDLHSLWAALLARAMSNRGGPTMDSVALILKDMPAEAAQLLNVLAHTTNQSITLYSPYSTKRFPTVRRTDIVQLNPLGRSNAEVGLEHLLRLRVLEPMATSGPYMDFPDTPDVTNPNQLQQFLDLVMINMMNGRHIHSDIFVHLTELGVLLFDLARQAKASAKNT